MVTFCTLVVGGITMKESKNPGGGNAYKGTRKNVILTLTPDALLPSQSTSGAQTTELGEILSNANGLAERSQGRPQDSCSMHHAIRRFGASRGRVV
jgi:hypothetical protein